MAGLGETRDELLAGLPDLRANDVDVLTVGQYLRPTLRHLPVERYVPPDEFAELKTRRPGARLPTRRERPDGALQLPRARPATIAARDC